MNLLYEDMHDTAYDDLQTHTKQIENPSSIDLVRRNIQQNQGTAPGFSTRHFGSLIYFI